MNKLCVDLIGALKTFKKIKEPLILKAITMIDPITGWFEIIQYDENKEMTIEKLV